MRIILSPRLTPPHPTSTKRGARSQTSHAQKMNHQVLHINTEGKKLSQLARLAELVHIQVYMDGPRYRLCGMGCFWGCESVRPVVGMGGGGGPGRSRWGLGAVLITNGQTALFAYIHCCKMIAKNKYCMILYTIHLYTLLLNTDSDKTPGWPWLYPQLQLSHIRRGGRGVWMNYPTTEVQLRDGEVQPSCIHTYIYTYERQVLLYR